MNSTLDCSMITDLLLAVNQFYKVIPIPRPELLDPGLNCVLLHLVINALKYLVEVDPIV